MISAVVAALFMGGVCQQQVLQKQVVAHAPAYLQIPYVDPYWSYRVGDDSQERLRKLEDIVVRQQEITEKQAAILEAIRGTPAGNEAGQESAATSGAKAIFEAHCNKCHTGDEAKGNFRLDAELSIVDKLLVAEVIRSGAMPKPPAEQLSDNDNAIIAAWANEDSKAVRAFLRSKKEPQP